MGEGPLDNLCLENLGRRIVEAARLAMAAHLYDSVSSLTHATDSSASVVRQRVLIGGAGPFVAEVGHFPDGRHDEVVTDDDGPWSHPARR